MQLLGHVGADWFAVALVLGLAVWGSGRPLSQNPKFNAALPLTHVENGTNSESARKAHYVVLVSLDGFRWDYAKRDGATHLLAMGKTGRVGARKGCCPAILR